MGTPGSGPDSTLTPSSGIAMAASPVAGHGSTGAAPGTLSEGGRARCSPNAGRGRLACSPAAATRTTTTTNASHGHRRRFSRCMSGADTRGPGETCASEGNASTSGVAGTGDSSTGACSGATSRIAALTLPTTAPGGDAPFNAPFNAPREVPLEAPMKMSGAASPAPSDGELALPGSGATPSATSTDEPLPGGATEAAPRLCRPRCRTTAYRSGSCSSSSGVMSTARAFDPSDGPTTPRRSRRSISRPALENPTRSLRCNIDVDPS
jgi:hypothetical protein